MRNDCILWPWLVRLEDVMQDPGRDLLVNNWYSIDCYSLDPGWCNYFSIYLFLLTSKLISGYIKGENDLCFKDY